MNATRRHLERAAREADRERLKRARRALQQAKADRRSSIRRARDLCKAAKAALAKWRREARKQLRAEVVALREQARRWPREQRAALRQEIDRRRSQVCGMCVTGRKSARLRGTEAVKAAKRRLADEKAAQAREKLWAKRTPIGTPKGAAKAVEKRRESDSDVEANLSPDELTVWRSVKARVKGSPRMSRLEAFQHWLHEHGAEVAELLERKAEAELRKLSAEEQQARKRMAKPYRSRSRDELLLAVSDVPF
jgi:hypothetical protein